MKKNLLSRFISFVLLFFALSFEMMSQVVYEPLHHDVYNFLSRLSQKGIIEFNDQIRPLPRKYIAVKLLEADSLSSTLTSLEKDELKFFLKDYYHEINLRENKQKDEKQLSYFNFDPAGRWRFLSYGDGLFKFNASIIFGGEIGSLDNSRRMHLWNGVYTYGYISDVIGLSFDFRDNMEKGTTIDRFKEFTPVTGVNERSDQNIFPYSSDKIEYEEAKGIIATDWSWGSAAVGKDFLEWGYGESGLIVLSQKAPSFPFIRLDISPVDWLSFNYFHAWLSSDVIDSTDIYYTDLRSERFSFREKYLASHTLTFCPLKGLDISLGESIVYSDKLELLYFLPISFFRLADHYLSRQYNAAGSNAQFFASVSSKNHLKNTHLYFTLYIDEITLNGLFNEYKQRNQIAFSLGGSVTDLPVENLTLKLEYTRTYPYVYRHYISTTTYESANYALGHWMKENADQVYASLKYRFLRGLEATVFGRYIRKGEEGDIEGTFIQPQPAFLFGLRTNYTYFGAQAQYEILHEFFLKARYQFTKASEEQEDHSFIDKDVNEFHLAVYYGL